MSRGWTLRHFDRPSDYRACVALQEEIWGPEFTERVPVAILKVSQDVGGVSAGAFDDDGGLLGFVFGLTGLREGRPTHWSDMLAVAARASGRGLGTALKAFQRDALLGLGVDEMRWTFDPLRARNAHVNLNKLGAVVREYREDMYGDSDSPVHRGLGTDRLIACWALRSERTERYLARALGVESAAGSATADATAAASAQDALTAHRSGAFPAPAEPVLDRNGTRVRIVIPTDIGAIMDADPSLAHAWRSAVREAFGTYLGRGYQALAFVPGRDTSGYLLERRP